MPESWAAIIVAAGRGLRFGGPKQFIELAGVPMVGWSIRTFAGISAIRQLIVVTEAEWMQRMRELLAALSPANASSVVEGGALRQDSVGNGLSQVGGDCDGVLVHDGARPLVTPDDVRAGMCAVSPGRAAVLASPVVDTIKVVDPQSRAVRETLDRNTLWAAQTPQFATTADLRAAHAAALRDGVQATDETALLERAGVRVEVIEASGENFKVTHPHDARRAALLLQERER